MKSSKLITRKALTQLMLAMVASGKAHRSDFESMDPNDIVLLAANLIDPNENYAVYIGSDSVPDSGNAQAEPEADVAGVWTENDRTFFSVVHTPATTRWN